MCCRFVSIGPFIRHLLGYAEGEQHRFRPFEASMVEQHVGKGAPLLAMQLLADEFTQIRPFLENFRLCARITAAMPASPETAKQTTCRSPMTRPTAKHRHGADKNYTADIRHIGGRA